MQTESGPRSATWAGALSPVRADDLAAHVLRGLLDRHPGLDPARIADVILGCANQAGEDNRNVARMALLLAGLPVTVPGETVNRLCASGMTRGGERGPRGDAPATATSTSPAASSR